MKEGYCALDKSVVHDVLNEPNLNAIILVHDDSGTAKHILESYDLAARRINLSFRHSSCAKPTKRYIFCRIAKSDFPIVVESNPITVVFSCGPESPSCGKGKLVALKRTTKTESGVPRLQDLLGSASNHFNEPKLQPIQIPVDSEMDNHRKDNTIEFVYYYRGSEPIIPLMHNLQIPEPFTNALMGNSEATWQLTRKPQLMSKGIAIDLDKISPDPTLIDIKYPLIFDMRESKEYAFQDAIDWIMRST